jgi:hypothetical protein
LSATEVPHPEAPVPADARRYPPVAEIATIGLVLIVIGGIFIAAYAPRKAPLAFPTVLTAAAIVLALWCAVTIGRLRGFAMRRFRQVFQWALLAYVIEGGMLLYVFVYDDIPGKTLALLTIDLVLFATLVPMIIGFTVARYERDVTAAG